jgi:hypothetical protein
MRRSTACADAPVVLSGKRAWLLNRLSVFVRAR